MSQNEEMDFLEIFLFGDIEAKFLNEVKDNNFFKALEQNWITHDDFNDKKTDEKFVGPFFEFNNQITVTELLYELGEITLWEADEYKAIEKLT